MNTALEMRTSVTLIGRLKQSPHDEAAWALFVKRYGPLILGWARDWNLQKADAENVAQNVLLTLVKELREFEYDADRGRFRGFLRTITQRALDDYVSTPQFMRERAQGGSEIHDILAQREAREDLAARLEKECDLELRNEAYRLVEQRVEPHNWQAFFLRHVVGIPGDEVAERLGMRRATVYAVARRVLTMITGEIERLIAQELGHANLPT